jgi:hypothetical protein
MARKAGLNLQRVASTWATAQSESFGRLEPEVSDLLVKLRQGALNTASGGLCINELGELAAPFYSRPSPLTFALGAFEAH